MNFQDFDALIDAIKEEWRSAWADQWKEVGA